MGSDESEQEQTDGNFGSTGEDTENTHIKLGDEDDFGDDFDDFEAGAEDADFGEMDGATQQIPIPSSIPPRDEAEPTPIHSLPAQDIPFVSCPPILANLERSL